MSHLAYFIGGPLDLTKRVLEKLEDTHRYPECYRAVYAEDSPSVEAVPVRWHLYRRMPLTIFGGERIHLYLYDPGAAR